MRNVVKGIAFLCLLFPAAGVVAAPKNPGMGLMHSDPGDDGSGGVLWVAENSYGDGLFRQLGSDESLRETFSYVSDIGETIDVKIDYETSEWSVTDAIDTLSFRRAGSGWVMERSKKGFSGKDLVYFSAAGEETSRNLALQAQVGANFAEALRNLQQFIDAGGGVSTVSSQTIMASCRNAMILGGLATIGESIGYGLTWFTGPVGGIAATPVYILAVKATNDWVLGQCGY